MNGLKNIFFVILLFVLLADFVQPRAEMYSSPQITANTKPGLILALTLDGTSTPAPPNEMSKRRALNVRFSVTISICCGSEG